MGCSRCGAESHTEYAPDGQSYCSSCIFYGLNKPCWKCRMYLPSTELQLYRGQWTCQYCLMDLRDAERHAEEAATAAPQKPQAGYAGRSEESHLAHVPEDERCDRCRRKLVIVYIFNNRKLCEICIKREKDEWEEKGTGAIPTVIKFKLKENEGLFSKLMRKLELVVGQLLESRRLKSRPKEPKQSTPSGN